MTDKEMIKAIECCLKSPVDCDNCAYTKYPVRDCNTILKNDIADLINRQQQEIERLKADIDVLKSELNDCECKNYDLENHKIYSESVMGKVRAEAIKEFAEKLKEFKYLQYEGEVVSVHCIDDIAEEMVGAE